jgi:C4-dicarboxylate-specific signal transduction histidine kinase
MILSSFFFVGQTYEARIVKLKAQQQTYLDSLERYLSRRRDLQQRHQRLAAELQQLVDTQDAKIRQYETKLVELNVAHEGHLCASLCNL